MEKRAKIALYAVGAFAALNVASLANAGWTYGWGPFAKLFNVRMRKHPGNDERYSMDCLAQLENSPLRGRPVLFLGSSVTFGHASLQKGIPEYFGARSGCTVTKEAVCGTTIVDDQGDSYVSRLMRNVDPNTDYALVVVQLSTNDASQKKPMGEIAEGFDPAAFDAHTITGAMETIIAYVRKTWGCPVAFYTGARYESEPYAQMVRRAYELQEKWGIGVLDLWSSDDLNAISDEQRALYMNDPIHPTIAGYRDWWCPELERQLLAFLEA